jgi:pimeloyl-ACP methyl ester carboxylesterase
LTVRDRQSGLGAPLIGVGKQLEPHVPPRRMPATVFLRVNGDVKSWRAGQMTASLELYSIYDTNRVTVAGQSLPLECDVTAPLAYAANDNSIWELDLAQFLSPTQLIKTGVYFTQPYQPGRIPVVFVHGTASSPIWWAEMWNTLRADTVLRQRCQFWYFTYNTGKPVSTSAADFRAALLQKVAELDPEGKDPALRQMVVVGHSQGGLLTALAATDTGDKLWRTSSDQNLDDLALPPEVRADLQRNFFFTPLPCVSRVVFICTPHRGSYRVTQFVLNLARRFMQLPADVVNTSSSLMLLRKPNLTPAEVRSRVPTSLDIMSPKNPWLLALAGIPVASGIKSHSIIAIKGDDKPPRGSDGVVKYTSAHLDYTESEFIVRSGHSCQSNPATIEEVRRILLEHLHAPPPDSVASPPAPAESVGPSPAAAGGPALPAP